MGKLKEEYNRRCDEYEALASELQELRYCWKRDHHIMYEAEKAAFIKQGRALAEELQRAVERMHKAHPGGL